MRSLPPLLAGFAALVALWEAIALSHAFGPSWPAPASVAAYAFASGNAARLADALLHTAREAVAGLAIGSAFAIALAAGGVLIPRAAAGLEMLAGVINGIPVVAVAGVCVLTAPRDATPTIVAALAVGFIVFVASSAAFRAASMAHRDVFAALGASRARTFLALELPAALPGLLDGLRTATPVAVVGAIVGEWFAAEAGLGPMLVAAMQNVAVPQLWAVALASALLSLTGYAILSAVRAGICARIT